MGSFPETYNDVHSFCAMTNSMDPLRLLQLRRTIQGTKEFIECETRNYKQQGAFTSCNFKLNCLNTGLKLPFLQMS